MNNLVDLHTHTVFSRHAWSTLTDNIDFALSKGMKYYGFSDHQPGDKKNMGADLPNIINVGIIPRKIGDLTILRGIEMNVGPNLEESYTNLSRQINNLDYAIGSIHLYDCPLNLGIDAYTNYYLEAINKPMIKILGHIDDGHYLPDYDVVIREAKAKNVLIEINNSSLNEGNYRLNSKENIIEILKICKEISAPIILNTDSHIKYSIGDVDNAFKICEELNFPHELIANINTDIIEETIDYKNKKVRL